MANSCLSTYSLKGIAYDCNSSLAGIKELYLSYYDDVQSVAVDLSAHTISAITFSSGVTWYQYSFARNTSSLSSTLTKDDTNGTRFYTNTIEVAFNKLEAKKHLEVMALAAEKLVALVVDLNGKKWFVGYDGYVSGTATEANTGASAEDRNGYTCTLEGTSAFLPFEYTGEIVYTPADTESNG